jgi:hypothetical protein
MDDQPLMQRVHAQKSVMLSPHGLTSTDRCSFGISAVSPEGSVRPGSHDGLHVIRAGADINFVQNDRM